MYENHKNFMNYLETCAVSSDINYIISMINKDIQIPGIVLVLICSLIIVMLEDKESIEVRLIDPILSLVSIAVLLGLSFPYSKYAQLRSVESNLLILLFL